MLRNYWIIAWRNLAKYKFISFINLFGLTVGLTCCLLILTYIQHETSYDRYNSKSGRIYRVTRSFNNKEGIVSLHLGAVAPPFGPLLQNEFPDIQKVTRMLPTGDQPIRYKEKVLVEKEVFFADSNLFGVFDIPLLHGDPRTALSEPFTLVLTEESARKYFGEEDPMGKVLLLDNHFNYKVTGIFRPLPPASHFHPEMMLSFSTLKDSAIYGEKNLATNFGNNAFYTYLLLPEHYPVQNLRAQLPSFLDRRVHFPGTPADYKPSSGTKLFLQALTDIHLHSHLDEEIEENGDSSRVYVFGAIALFILLIACINYMNLSTARSTLRAREIGIRKVAGAQRKEIITQFLGESVLLTYVAIGLAGALAGLLLPWLNHLTGLSLSFHSLLQTKILLPIVGAPLAIGLLSGLYPALFMSSFQPSKVLKGLFKAGSGSLSFRKVLVVFQFSISIVLLIATAVVFQQLHYMQNTSLGFDKAHILTLRYPGALNKNFESFRQQLLRNPHIRQATRSSRIPSGRLLDDMDAATESGDSLRPVSADIKFVSVDYNFIKTYGIPLAAGRDFSRDYGTDSTGFLLNEAATRAIGSRQPREMVGKNFRYASTKGKVIGVVKDFNFESMHQAIVPLILVIPAAGQEDFFRRLSVKLSGNADELREAITHLEKTWKGFLPETPFEYSFLDDRFNQLYQSEQRQGTLFTVFASIAIFIACLGLLGLSAFSISQRLKEIGVRKVLGASTGSIVGLLSGNFLKLVAIAAAVAFPVAWWVMHHWLQDFAYRISIQWWVFGLAGLIAAAVALVTISFQAIRAALGNPIRALRSE